MKQLLIIITLSLLTQIAFGELLTKSEIASEIGSRTDLSLKQVLEVTDVIYDFLSIVEEEYDVAIDEAVQLHEEEVAAVVKEATVKYDTLYTDKEFWKTAAFVEGGIIVIETVLFIVVMFAR